MSAKLTFSCDFGPDVSATLDFDPAKYRKGKAIYQRIYWKGKPTPEIIPRYLEWTHTVNAEISRVVNGKFLYLAQTGADPSGWERWVYYPDGRRERV